MANGWRIGGQRQTEKLNPQGTFDTIVKVTFVLDSGTTGVVDIPARLYSPEYVEQVVGEAARTMHAVNNLTGSV